MKQVLFLFLTTLFYLNAFAQDCPHIFQRGDTLFADPQGAIAYKWYRKGILIPGQTKSYLRIGDFVSTYNVEIGGFSATATAINLNVNGRVFNETLQPVVGATVTMNGNTTTTNAQGHYAFSNVPGFSNVRYPIEIAHSNYFKGFATVMFQANGVGQNTATLLFAKGEPVTFNSADGMRFNNSQFSLKIPKDGISKNGQPYTGEVKLYWAHYAPKDPLFGLAMPGGDMFALDENGIETTLRSFGFCGVEMTDPNGNVLNLATGKKAQVDFRLPEGATPNPSTAFWYFDETMGLWREEAAATLYGERYSGEVEHFSWWNCDYGGPLAYIFGRLVDCSNQPVAGASVCTETSFGTRCGISDQNGDFFTSIPANDEMTISTTGDDVVINVAPDDTLGLGDLMVGSDLIASGLLTYTEAETLSLSVFTNGGAEPFEYSLDSSNWQSGSTFTPLFETSYDAYVREAGGCVHVVHAEAHRQNCFEHIPSPLDSLPVYTSFVDALAAYNNGETIWRYHSGDSLLLAIQTFPCLRDLDLSNTTLTQVPNEIANLWNLERLNLQSMNLDTVPSVVFSLPSLEVLDMRYNNIPEVDRAGYEGNLPGVTIYWEACYEPGGWSLAIPVAGDSSFVAAHADGSFSMTGYFYDTATFGTISLVSAGDADIFVAHYDANGNVLWVKRAGGNGYDFGNSIAAHTDGSVTITGYFYGTATFDNISLVSAGYRNIFVAHYDANGNVLWAKRAGGTSYYDKGNSIAAHTDGSVTATGYFIGTATFDNISLVSAGGTDIFVAHYDANGQVLWAKRAGGIGDDSGISIAAHTDGSVTVTGYFEGTATFDNISLVSAGWQDIFIAHYDANGNAVWAKRAGGTGYDYGKSIAAHTDGSVTVTGYFDGTATFDNISLVSAGGYDIFVAHYDVNGNVIWAKRAGGANYVSGASIAAHTDGSVTVTGYFYGTATFDNISLVSAGGSDIFVAHYDANGQVLSAIRAGGNDGDYGNSIAIGPDGEILVAGESPYNGATFGNISIPAGGFVARMCPE